jgi:PurA ssDNA and RNA-binding protein
MISNEKPSPFGPKPYSNQNPTPQADVLLSRELQVERKTFSLSLKENARGRFLSVTENTRNGHEMIIIPAGGLEEFKKIFGDMVKAASETPVKGEVDSPSGNP